MSTNTGSPDFMKWYDEDCSLKKPFICSTILSRETFNDTFIEEKEKTSCPPKVRSFLEKQNRMFSLDNFAYKQGRKKFHIVS